MHFEPREVEIASEWQGHAGILVEPDAEYGGDGDGGYLHGAGILAWSANMLVTKP